MFYSALKKIVRIFPIVIALFFAFSIINFSLAKTPPINESKKSDDPKSMSQETLAYFTNKTRIENNLPALQDNFDLQSAAQKKAEDMAEKNYFDHTSPEGKEFWYWIKQETSRYSFVGENLAINFVDPQETVEAWMDSKLHRENILNSEFQEIGIGTAKGEYKGKTAIYVVEIYGKPRGSILGFIGAE
jgi:uncharacterized protein YkwD